MNIRLAFIILFIIGTSFRAWPQCATPINTFPYLEGFESSDGGWTSGGAGNDWAWGTPAKPVISAAGGGSKCWVIGGLTGSSYTNSEASWLQSPCFDFSSLLYPYIECKVFWEMEQRFDGASLQYSIDNGASWNTVGSTADAINCLNANWYNYPTITYLAPLTANRVGWSGNKQASAGSCFGGNGSNVWLTAKHTMPYLAGKPAVIFRFIFGAGTICNNYDGFAIDDINIMEAPPNSADFSFACVSGNTVNFTDLSAPCPSGFSWDFGDPVSGTTNLSSVKNPTHNFSGPGVYTVKLTVSGPDNAPANITKQVTILGLATSVVTPADCATGTGGEATVSVTGGTGPFTYSWNTIPVQTTVNAVGLGHSTYAVTVSGINTCPANASVTIPLNTGCGGVGIFFPSAFTPDGNGKNDRFGAIGELASLTSYRISVYNRWGELVFRTTNPFVKWNGKIGSIDTDSNIFVWFAEYSLMGSAPETRKGTVVLIR